MDLSDALLHLFGIVSQWNLRARGYGLLLLRPVLIVAAGDWRMRRPR